jgi:hypothetical protein
LIFPRIAKLTSPDKLFSRLLYISACLTTLYPVIALLYFDAPRWTFWLAFCLIFFTNQFCISGSFVSSFILLAESTDPTTRAAVFGVSQSMAGMIVTLQYHNYTLRHHNRFC